MACDCSIQQRAGSSNGRHFLHSAGMGHPQSQCWSPVSPKSVEVWHKSKVLWQGMRVTRLASGAEHSMAITADGAVFSWGWGRYGCIGDGGFQDRCTPANMPTKTGSTDAMGTIWHLAPGLLKARPLL